MNDEEFIEKVKDLIENRLDEERRLLDGFLNLLFWKDYSSGYVKYEDRSKILFDLGKCTKVNKYYGEYGNEQIHRQLDAEKAIPLVNKIRVQLGLPEIELLGEYSKYLSEKTNSHRDIKPGNSVDKSSPDKGTKLDDTDTHQQTKPTLRSNDDNAVKGKAVEDKTAGGFKNCEGCGKQEYCVRSTKCRAGWLKLCCECRDEEQELMPQ